MNTKHSETKDPISSPLTKGGTIITPVYLNLYDLGGCVNAVVHTVGLTFYHCAVQAHSAEYGFMGHPFKFTGIYKTSKHDSRFHLYRLRDTIEFGWTWFTENEIDEIFDQFKLNYFGCDYHPTKKTSIDFVRDFLVRLTNEIQLKQIKSIDLTQFPSYIDRSRRWSENFTFFKYFDSEKEIAEINIIYFLYMKFEGNLCRICRTTKCETIERFKRTIQLIKQGIDDGKIPHFLAFETTEIQATYEILHPNEKKTSSIDDEISLTEIFHQFDTITLRGRTSIDRYLNFHRNENCLSSVDQNLTKQNFFVSSSRAPRSEIKMNSFGKFDSFVSMPFVSPVENSTRRYFNSVQTKVHLEETSHPNQSLIKDDLSSDFPLMNHRTCFNNEFQSTLTTFDLLTSKRKLPRDRHRSYDFLQISKENCEQLSLTNNAICKRNSSSSFPRDNFTDSNV